MKFRLVLLTVIVLSLVLSACGGGGGDGGDPEKPVKDFFNAFADLDAEKASEAVCKKYRDDLKAGLELIFGFIELAGEDAKIEIVDLKLEVQDKKDDEAMIVATSGKIRMTAMGETEETDLAGEQEPVKVIKEDGKWVICDSALATEFAP